MSYILNALKKAEHDRLREAPEDLDDFVNSGWDPYEKTRQSSATYWLPIGIIVIAAGLFYGFSSLKPETPAPVAEIETPETPETPEAKQNSVAAVEDKVIEENLLEQSAVAENPVVPSSGKIAPVTAVNNSLPEVNISGHIFIRAGSRLNQIFVGERSYHVGDTLDRNWVIESINSDSLKLRSGTQTTELPLR